VVEADKTSCGDVVSSESSSDMSHIMFLFLNASLLDSVQIRAESRMCSPSLVLQAFGMHSKVRSYRHVRWKGGRLRMPKVANCESDILIVRYHICVPSRTARYACLMSGFSKTFFFFGSLRVG